MADAIQLASAVTSLISATCVAIDYLVRLNNATNTARELLKKVRELEHVLRLIESIVRDLSQDGRQTAAEEENVTLLKQGLMGCIQGCHSSIEQMVSKLNPLDNQNMLQRSINAVRFTFNEKEVKMHQATIEGHLQRLHLLQSSLLVISSRRNDDNHFATQHSLSQLRELILFVLGLLLQQNEQQQKSSHSQHAIMGIRTHTTDRPQPALPSSEAIGLLLPAPHLNLESPYDNFNPRFNSNIWNRPEQVAVPILNRQADAEEVFVSGNEEMSDDSSGSGSLTREIPSDGYLVDTPLAAAVKSNQAVIVKSLIDRGCDLEDTDTEAWTYLHHAVWVGAHSSVEILLQGAQDRSQNLIDAVNNKGQTALMLCTQRLGLVPSSLQIAAILIDYKANVNAEDRTGRTALHHVVVGKVPTPSSKAFATLLLNNEAKFGDRWQRKLSVSGILKHGWIPEVEIAAGRRKSSVATNSQYSKSPDLQRRKSSGATSSQFGTSPETESWPMTGSLPVTRSISNSNKVMRLGKRATFKRIMSGSMGLTD